MTSQPAVAPMHVCLVVAGLGPGGTERVLSMLANSLVARGHHVSLLTFDDGATPPFFALEPAVDHRPLGLPMGNSLGIMRIWNNLRRVAMLRRAFKRFATQSVLSFGDQTNVTALLAARGMGLRVVVSERTDPSMLASGRLWNQLCRVTYPLAAQVVVQSKGAAEYYRPRLQRPLTGAELEQRGR